jgi:hypothetical protein
VYITAILFALNSEFIGRNNEIIRSNREITGGGGSESGRPTAPPTDSPGRLPGASHDLSVRSGSPVLVGESWYSRRNGRPERVLGHGFNLIKPVLAKRRPRARKPIAALLVSGSRGRRRCEPLPQRLVLRFQFFDPEPDRRERRRQFGLGETRREVLRTVPVERLEPDEKRALG